MEPNDRGEAWFSAIGVGGGWGAATRRCCCREEKRRKGDEAGKERGEGEEEPLAGGPCLATSETTSGELGTPSTPVIGKSKEDQKRPAGAARRQHAATI